MSLAPLVLGPGANAELPAHTAGRHVDVLVSHISKQGVDLDLAMVAVGADGRVGSDRDFVFFNNPRHPSGCIEHLGQRQHEGRSWDGSRIHLDVVPESVTALHATLSGEHDGFPSIPDLRVEILDHLGHRIVSIDVARLSVESAAVALEIYRRSGVWKVRAVVQGWDAGLSAVVEHFGVEVDEPSPTTQPAPVPAPAPAESPQSAQTAPSPSALPAPVPATPALLGTPAPKRGLFGPRRRDLQRELDATRAEVASLGALDAVAIARVTAERRSELQAVTAEVSTARRELAEIRSSIVEVDDVSMLQSVGIYEFAHPLDNAVAHKERLTRLKEQYKDLVRTNNAVHATTNWQINGSVQQGAKMVRDTSKLMLRSYNAEADNCVRVVRPHSLDSNLRRLDKARETIAKLGSIMAIRISDRYHRLRLDEIRLTADYHAKVEEEREEQRAAREREREDKQAQLEYEREWERLDRERAQVERALEVALHGSASAEAVQQLRDRLQSVDAELEEAALRAANARLGFVYVISNIGAFGPSIVKIGMTRRREPMDRVRELGDASVPFLFDVHALIFSEDALGLEAKLHAAFASRRVNRVNLRREFFYVTPEDVRQELRRLEGEHLLDFKDTALADEWRRSQAIASAELSTP